VHNSFDTSIHSRPHWRFTPMIGLPQVLCLSGLDPTGGAGVQADIEAVAGCGGHALGVVTALTAQDSRNVEVVEAVSPTLLARQLDLLLADCRVDAVKIGLLGSAAQLAVIVPRITALKVPIICDPVLRAGGGTQLANTDLIAAMWAELFPAITVLTPNAAEARTLTGQTQLDDAAAALLAGGCDHVLITGGDESAVRVNNYWYSELPEAQPYSWDRLPETFHGAGCTLAAALATCVARGFTMDWAVKSAQLWTQQTLQRAFAVGHGRRIPNRHCTAPPTPTRPPLTDDCPS